MTYDLSVPDNATYIANGFISHNTIGLMMDCDTTGVEPDFSLVKFKKLAGGGYFKIINRAVPEALRTLGYGEAQIAEIEAYAVGHGNLNQAPAINPASGEAVAGVALVTLDRPEVLNALGSGQCSAHLWGIMCSI